MTYTTKDALNPLAQNHPLRLAVDILPEVHQEQDIAVIALP